MQGGRKVHKRKRKNHWCACCVVIAIKAASAIVRVSHGSTRLWDLNSLVAFHDLTHVHTHTLTHKTATLTEQTGFKWCPGHKLRLFFQDEVFFNAPLLSSNRPTCSAGMETEAHRENEHGASGATYFRAGGVEGGNPPQKKKKRHVRKLQLCWESFICPCRKWTHDGQNTIQNRKMAHGHHKVQCLTTLRAWQYCFGI